MKRYIGWSLAAVLPAVVMLAAGPIGPATGAVAAPTAPATAPSWSVLEQQALQAASHVIGGQLTIEGAAGPVVQGTVATLDGTVSLTQRTVAASSPAGTQILELSLLGGTQLVVSDVDPAAGRGEALVLSPGTSSVSGSYPIAMASPATTSAGRGHHVSTVAEVRHTVSGHAGLVTYGGCGAAPETPGVIGSIYGPLVLGVGLAECPGDYSISIIAGIYRNFSTQVGLAGGSTYTWYFAINVFDACYLISGGNYFTTEQLWSVTGNLQPGAYSGTSWLHCA